MIDESEVKIRKFKMFADKATTETQLVDLCKKYLKHKGIDAEVSKNVSLEELLKPPKIETHYVGIPDLTSVHGMYTIDRMNILSATEEKQVQTYARKCVTENIMHELVRNDVIKFEILKDHSCDHITVRGKLLVYKEK